MEAEGRDIDYFACPVALNQRSMLSAARSLIAFETLSGNTQLLVDWEAAARH